MFLMFSLIITFVINDCTTVFAKQKEWNIEQEFMELKSEGVEAYAIRNDEGKMIAYYVPFDDESEMPVQPRTTIVSTLNWTLSPYSSRYHKDSLSYVKGDKIVLDIAQNPTGSSYSYVGLRDSDSGHEQYVSASTSGWIGGTIVVGYSGHFSLCIRNGNSCAVNYNGRYYHTT